MSFIRAFSFFSDNQNHTLAFSAENTNITDFVNFINERCHLNLSETDDSCIDPEMIALGQIGNCTKSDSWFQTLSLQTCNQLSEFSEAALTALETAAADYFKSLTPTCPKEPTSHTALITFSILGTIALCGVCVCFFKLLAENEDRSENTNRHRCC